MRDEYKNKKIGYLLPLVSGLNMFKYGKRLFLLSCVICFLIGRFGCAWIGFMMFIILNLIMIKMRCIGAKNYMLIKNRGTIKVIPMLNRWDVRGGADI